jgi:hypothetical protein
MAEIRTSYLSNTMLEVYQYVSVYSWRDAVRETHSRTDWGRDIYMRRARIICIGYKGC